MRDQHFARGCRVAGRTILLTSLLAAGLVGLARTGTQPAGPAGTAALAAYSAPHYRMIQSNEAQGMGTGRLEADVRKLTRLGPDFITYNEVSYRKASSLAPGHYDVYHHAGAYQGESAVAWDHTRWSDVTKGVWMISNKTGRPAGQKLDWGVRYATWVTLRNKVTGHRVSVIATHFAPDTRYTRGLAKPSAERLTYLVRALQGRGPVLVGGDLNMQYGGRRYPRSTFAAAHLIPTYDVTRKVPVTNGTASTIDYLMVKGIARFTTGNQKAIATNSDHNALLADFSPLPLATTLGDSKARFGAGVVATDPGTTAREEHTMVNTPLKAINSAPAGASLHVATRSLAAARIVAALERAYRRGVHVQVVTAESSTTAQMRSLQALLGTKVSRKSWAVSRPAGYRKAKLLATVVLASRTGATPSFSFNSASPLTPAANSGTRTGYLSVTRPTYDHFFVPFFAAVGRKV